MNDYSYVVGFNYIPSYAYNLYDVWKLFDADVFDREIGLGKMYFPKMNTIRLWLSYDAFYYEEDRQARNFETALTICAKYGCKVIVCLFNCWHDSKIDAGGTYHPMMIPKSISSSSETMYDSYFEKIVEAHKNDDRILVWDICNEPYSFGGNREYMSYMEPYETAWLNKMCDKCHLAGVSQPVGISHHAAGAHWDRQAKTIDSVDIILVHPYYYFSDDDFKNLPPEGFDKLLEEFNSWSKKYNKPVLTTETCWGSRDDSIRTEIIRQSLTAHKKAKIGYIAHALHWSHFADLHNECDGHVGMPGNLMFITRDDKIRQGHEVFNEF